MSTTTTTAPVSTAIREVLADYDLHHSSSPGRSTDPAPAPNTRDDTAATVSNPANWTSDHRGVPPYRPIDRHLDLEQRPGGTSVPEYIFIAVMLNGVGVAAFANSIWRSTGGKINDKIFRYQIGGEW